MKKSHVVVVDGRFVGAAVRRLEDFRFVAVDASVRPLDASLWPSLAALLQAAAAQARGTVGQAGT